MPSFINQLMLTELKGSTGTAESLIIIDHSKLNAEDTIKFRSDLRKAGAKLKVSKVRLMRRTIPASAAKVIEKSKGSVGVVVTQDMVAAAKIVAALAKEDKLALRGGLMDGAALDVASVKRISELPSKQQLHGMLVNVLAAPIVGFARVIAEINKKQGGTGAEPAPAAEAAAPVA
jgi:large subunit ribosomal protein L10